ncbi:hypothetical protein [Paenibacillus dakarensis]|uniref:hypothetical protein n=1 Tax=Paenibacillus dakarensis TaxID=1527293 RepID=UPI000AD4641C|nr:hypothetical protein [Paenibacillus dakarensis]
MNKTEELQNQKVCLSCGGSFADPDLRANDPVCPSCETAGESDLSYLYMQQYYYNFAD